MRFAAEHKKKRPALCLDEGLSPRIGDKRAEPLLSCYLLDLLFPTHSVRKPKDRPTSCSERLVIEGISAAGGEVEPIPLERQC